MLINYLEKGSEVKHYIVVARTVLQKKAERLAQPRHRVAMLSSTTNKDRAKQFGQDTLDGLREYYNEENQRHKRELTFSEE